MPIMLRALRIRAEILGLSESVKDCQYNAGLYYETHDDIINALHMYKKCGASDRIKSLLIRNARQELGTARYYELKDYYFELGEDEIEKVPVLMSGMSMVYAILMQEEKSEYWYNRLVRFVCESSGGEYREAVSCLSYLDISLAHRGSKNIQETLTKAFSLVESNIQMPGFSTTGNIPSVLNGGKDFCELTVNDREFISENGDMFERLLGAHGRGVADSVKTS